MKKSVSFAAALVLLAGAIGVLGGFTAPGAGGASPPVPPVGRFVGQIDPRPRTLTFAVSVMDDSLTALPAALVTVAQGGLDTIVTGTDGFAELPRGAVDHRDLTVTIRHPATLRQVTTLRVPDPYDRYTLVYAAPLWRPGSIDSNDSAVRTGNQLNVLQTGPWTITQPFDFDYCNLAGRNMIEGFVLGSVPADAHAALVMRAVAGNDVDGLTINVDTEGVYGDSVPATVVAVDSTGSPFPGLQVNTAPPLPGYPTALSVTGTFPKGEPVLFLFLGQPVASALGGGLVTTSSPCSTLPPDNTNPDPDICGSPFTYSPQAQMLGCTGNCNGQTPRKGKFGGKVTGQVGSKVGVSASGGGAGASIEVSSSGEVSGWFEEDYDVAPHKQRCWYLCSRKTTWFCYGWLSEWFGFPPSVQAVYSVGTDVIDSDC